MADIDLDGRKDIYLASSNYPGTHAWIFHQKQDGTFENVTDKAQGWHASTEAPALVDIDNDGDLDVIAGSGTFNYAAATNAIHVYRNEIVGNYTRVRLLGKGAGFANRNGIGARVKVTAGGHSQYQELHGANAHTEAGVELTFGLGTACAIDSIEVRWPNGDLTTSTYTNVIANATVEPSRGRRESPLPQEVICLLVRAPRYGRVCAKRFLSSGRRSSRSRVVARRRTPGRTGVPTEARTATAAPIRTAADPVKRAVRTASAIKARCASAAAREFARTAAAPAIRVAAWARATAVDAA